MTPNIILVLWPRTEGGTTPHRLKGAQIGEPLGPFCAPETMTVGSNPGEAYPKNVFNLRLQMLFQE